MDINDTDTAVALNDFFHLHVEVRLRYGFGPRHADPTASVLVGPAAEEGVFQLESQPQDLAWPILAWPILARLGVLTFRTLF